MRIVMRVIFTDEDSEYIYIDDDSDESDENDIDI